MKFKVSQILIPILFLTFSCNAILGYAFSNVLIGGIPINEILLVVSLLLINKELITIFKKYHVLLILLIWSVTFLVTSVAYGFLNKGIWALRDASHLIESFWVFVVIYVLERKKYNFTVLSFLKLIIIIYFIKIISLAFPEMLKGVFVISGLQSEIDLLASKNGLFIIFFMLFSLILITNKNKYFLVFLIITHLVLHQKRTMYIGLISSLFLYLLLFQFPLKTLINYFFKTCILLFFLFVVSMFSSLIGDLEIRKLVYNINPNRIFLKLMASTGSSEEFKSAADGTPLRIDFIVSNLKKSTSDIWIFFFGQGFGHSLTDFISDTENITREPHNSFLSVFARTGITGFLTWLLFHFIINFRAFKILSRYRFLISKNFDLCLLFVCFFTLNAMYLFSLVEPGFESPYLCINLYIIIGTIVYLNKKIQLN